MNISLLFEKQVAQDINSYLSGSLSKSDLLSQITKVGNLVFQVWKSIIHDTELKSEFEYRLDQWIWMERYVKEDNLPKISLTLAALDLN